MVEKLITDSAGIILDLKYHFNRPRPGILAKEYNIKLGEVIISSMKTPSYPSRHSTQGYLIGYYLSEKYDDPKLMREFMALKNSSSCFLGTRSWHSLQLINPSS